MRNNVKEAKAEGKALAKQIYEQLENQALAAEQLKTVADGNGLPSMAVDAEELYLKIRTAQMQASAIMAKLPECQQPKGGSELCG